MLLFENIFLNLHSNDCLILKIYFMAHVIKFVKIDPDTKIDPTDTVVEYSISKINSEFYLILKNRGSENARNKNPKQKFQIKIEDLLRILVEGKVKFPIIDRKKQ